MAINFDTAGIRKRDLDTDILYSGIRPIEKSALAAMEMIGRRRMESRA